MECVTVLWVYEQAAHVSAAPIRQREGEEKLLQWNVEPDQKPQRELRIQHPWAAWRRQTEQDRAEKNRASIQTFPHWKHFEWAGFFFSS